MAFCGLQNGVIQDGFCAVELPIELSLPRSVRALGTDDLLVLERGTDSVAYLYDSDGDGLPDSKQTVASAASLNHGLALHQGYLYASSDSTVYRWPYTDFNTPVGEVEIAVVNINENGMGGAPRGHQTRTLEFDDEGRLYISVGSDGNVDPDSYRSRIRRVDLSNVFLTLPQDFQLMEVFADGLRNEVGLAFDRNGTLWGVENSADNLQRSDIGGDITENNPAEELNRFREEDAGKHYGYPYCWTEYALPEPYGLGRGTVWAWPSFLENGQITDDQCRSDYVPPMLSLQAHSAPLGVTFYDYVPQEELPDACNGTEPFPEEMDGYAFIAYHGSWNREVPTGYKVVYVPMSDGIPLGQPVDLLAHEPPDAKWENGFRPVDVAFDPCGRLYVTSDGTGGAGSKVVRIDFIGVEEPSCPPSSQPSLLASDSQSFRPTSTTSLPPSRGPSQTHSGLPSTRPSAMPSGTPSARPSGSPSLHPSCLPSKTPSAVPSSSSLPNRISWHMCGLLAVLLGSTLPLN